MKAKVFERLKLKAKDFGFTDEELKTVCEPIANLLAQKEDATDEDIDNAVDSYLPVLKLSQSASNRSFEKMKKQFEEQNRESIRKREEEEARRKAEEETNKKPVAEDGGEPEWFRTYRESVDQKLADQARAFEDYRRERDSEGFLSKVRDGLRDVDPGFYSLMLEGRTFDSEEAADKFVAKVTESWETFCRERKLEAVKKVVPPAGGGDAPEKPSEGVLRRIEDRKRKAEALKDINVFKGLPGNM